MILNHRWLNNSLVLKNLDVVVSPRLILLALARKAIGLEDKVKTSVVDRVLYLEKLKS